MRIAILLIAGLFACGSAGAETIKIRWLLAHDPAKAFDGAAKQFRETVEKETGGAVQVEVLTVKEFNHGQDMSETEVLDGLKSGSFEMCQTFASFLGSVHPEFWVFDLPYLFRNYQQAETVLTGRIGERILSTLDSDNLKGLALTYSGGLRVIPSANRKITRLEDFRGLRVRVPKYSMVSNAFFKRLGATPLPLRPEAGANAEAEQWIDAQDTTVPRFLVQHQNARGGFVNVTDHSLYVTALAVNKSFFDRLPAKFQKIIADAARAAGEKERTDSIALAAEETKELVKQGMKVVSLPEAEKDRVAKASAPVYASFEKVIGASLIQEIRDTK